MMLTAARAAKDEAARLEKIALAEARIKGAGPGECVEVDADIMAQTFGDPRLYIDERAPEDCRQKGPVELEKDVKVVLADEAKNIVAGARRSAYGKPEQNFERIARFWQAYFENTGRGDAKITARDVSPLMRLMKEARLAETPNHRDSFVDLIGYTLTGAEVNGVEA